MKARENSLPAPRMAMAKQLQSQMDSEQESEVLGAVAAYDAFAPYYRSYSAARGAYLRQVEDIVIVQAGHRLSVLDVGAGDGVRTCRVAHAVGATRVVMTEPSAEMRALCPENVEIWACRAEAMPDTTQQFDLVLCLWNVLGHVAGVQERVLALSQMKKLLSPGGTIFIDVSHRYNAAAYGWIKTFLRMTHDLVIRSEKQGDVIVSWQAGETRICTRGHVFTHSEMKTLFDLAGLRIAKRWVIDYENGRERRLSVFGHLLYQLTAA
jgi:ubiquinone/menaquinone biosynthesis C-methylase UbiE